MIKLEVWGERALFTRPEFKAERVSYDVITPSAACGILKSIYWHPGITWVIDRIFVMNPIRFTNIRRNEVKSKIPKDDVLSVVEGTLKKQLYLATTKDRTQRNSMVLSDVRYIIEAHFVINDKAAPSDNPGKFSDIINRRLETGQCFRHPCLGCSEFAANFQKYEGGTITTAYPNSEKDLGFMLFDIDYTDMENVKPMIFRAVMRNGIIDLRDCEVLR